MEIEEYIENLQTATEECKSDGDYLSLLTIIDTYSEELTTTGTSSDNLKFLTALQEIVNDADILAEIGWDLPKILVGFICWTNVNLYSAFRDTPTFTTLVAIFQVLGMNGPPKEILLSCCEILGNLEIQDLEEDETLPKQPGETILDLQLHFVMELINVSLKRINSDFPSRFLAMAVTAILKFYRKNAHLPDVVFLMRRVFAFIKGYIPPIGKSSEDEEHLQRQLLCYLCTTVFGLSFSYRHIMWSTSYYNTLKTPARGTIQFDAPLLKNEYFMKLNDISSRYYNMALSMDIDVVKEFSHLVKESREIYSVKIPDEGLYQLAYNRRLVELSQPSLKLDPIGVLYLAAIYNQEIGRPCIKMTIDDAIYLSLRMMSPGMFSEKLAHRGINDACIYFCWVALSTEKNEITVPNTIIAIFLQMLLTLSSKEHRQGNRVVVYTLFARLLCMVPEKVAFDFIIDTLLTCPFVNAQVAVIGVLKDLIIRSRPPLEEQLASLSLDAPPVPPRSYVSLDDDQMAQIYGLISSSIKEVFDNYNAEDEGAMKKLQTYLNFLVGVRLKFSEALNEMVVEEIEPHLNKDGNAVQICRMAVDSLKRELQ